MLQDAAHKITILPSRYLQPFRHRVSLKPVTQVWRITQAG